MSRMISDREPNLAERCVSGIPTILSYVILGVTWLAFELVVSVHQVLFKRHEILHFFVQQIVYNWLCGMTMLSLFVASTRGPGRPNPDLAPPDVCRPPEMVERSPVHQTQRIARKPRKTPKPISLLPPVEADPDDIPLRFLRNSQWVNSRLDKARPSPLPVRKSHYSEPYTYQGKLAESSSSSSANQPISPFPINANPLAPHTADQAGEDPDEEWEDQQTVRAVEGKSGARVDPMRETNDEDNGDANEGVESQLLPGPETRQRRSIMAKNDNGGPRWCRKCDAWKPDRTHHCRFCRKCTLKMDHHCVWLGTCVGFHNYKPFLLFITYGTLLSLYAMLEAGYEAFRFFTYPEEFFETTPSVGLNGTCVGNDCSLLHDSTHTVDDMQIDMAPVVFLSIVLIGAVFLLAVGSLAGYHWWLASRNMTTIESLNYSYPSVLLEKEDSRVGNESGRRVTQFAEPLSRDQRNRLRREARDINIYDLGLKENIRSIFGDRSVFLALWPTIRAYRKRDVEAGHFFDVDEEKLERLKDITRKLRQPEHQTRHGRFESESDLSSEEEDAVDDYPRMDVDVSQPTTGSSGGRGDDELTDVELGSGSSTRKPVAWFQP